MCSSQPPSRWRAFIYAPRRGERRSSARGLIAGARTRAIGEVTGRRTKTPLLAATNTELSRALNELRHKDERLAANIEEARQFQSKILPAMPEAHGFDLAAIYQPLEVVSGDIFDVCELGQQRLRLFLADATGHGVQAAMRTTLLKTEYDRIKRSAQDPMQALKALNERLLASFPGGEMLCTALCLDVWRVEAGAAAGVVANAACPMPVTCRKGEVREVICEGALLGIEHDFWPPPTPFRLEVGDLLVLFSDGLCEQLNGDKLMFSPLTVVHEAHRSEGTAQQSLDCLWQRFNDFRSASPVADDVTILAVRLTALEPVERHAIAAASTEQPSAAP